jgi:hypothetical protein
MKRIFVAAAIAASIWLTTEALAYKAAGELLPSAPTPPNPAADQGLVKPPSKPSKKTLRAFASDAEISQYLHEVAEKQKQLTPVMKGVVGGVPGGVVGGALGSVQFEAAAPAPPTAIPAAGESVTNVQHAGVDEGGIVKVYGDYLVILRRGRLFTVSIAKGALTPVSSVDAYGPEVDPARTWYDEMLVANGTVAVIGYSYERGGTEVGLFDIDPEGKLSYRSTYQLRSNDYYSSRNYASRLIGDKLIFYTPLYLNGPDFLGRVPAQRKWRQDAGAADFRRIAFATDIYRSDGPAGPDASTLHTVTTCDLSGGGFDCKATSVLGPPGRVFYVSPHAVYVWVTDWRYQAKTWQSKSMLYRMPLDGSAPSALRVSGGPVDQFSFLEGPDGYLNVLVRSDSVGDGMWGAETAAGSMALLRAPLSRFSDGTTAASASDYRSLPTPKGGAFQNRFVGDYLLYGVGSGWGDPQEKSTILYAVGYAGGDLEKLTLTHGVDRIEPMGRDAVIVGANGTDLHFTSVRLGRSPQIADDYVWPHASQGELRSHGFFYRPEPEAQDSGMFGLPIAEEGRPDYQHLVENSAAILFVKNDSLRFNEMGELASGAVKTENDGCRASCVDWYGNARPLFVHGRIIALLGYELVEGTVGGRRVSELRRVDYSRQNFVSWRR